MNSYQDFVKGRFTGVALDRDGRLLLAPKLETLFASGQPVIWAVAQAPDGSLYAATGHRGHVYRIAPDGTSSSVWTSEQPEIFAIAVDSAGVLYAASSPDGKVYRIENGKASELFAPKAKYIWSLTVASDGSLYVGTGEPANVYKINSGKGELYYETGQSHVTSLALDKEQRVLAGTEPNGILYRITAKDKAFVLYDANLPEIRSIVPMPDGTIYAAAMGGSLLNRTSPLAAGASAAYSMTVTGAPTSITVSDTQAGPDLKPKTDSKQGIQNVTQSAGTAAAVVDLAGVEKSAVYKINPDLTVETVWSSKEENAYGLLVRPSGELLVATDGQGRIYRQGPDRKPALMAQTNEGETTRLLMDAKGLLASTGDAGKLFRLGDTPATNGSYESPVHDSGAVARWGRLTWRANGGRVSFQTRTGNSARPDKTWSDWSQPIADLSNSVVRSPNARYIQWRTDLSGPKPVVENVIIAYLPQNNPPVVRSITVSTQAAAAGSQKSSSSSAASAAYSVTVTDTGEAQSSSAGTPTQTLARGSGGQIQVTWQADDPDGDRVAYTIYFRGEEEQEWKVIRSNIFENSILLDGDVLADGRYFFRVVATDRPSNDAASARQAELVSSPVLVDNTPPVVTLSTPVRTDSHVDLNVDAADRTSPLRRCEYSLDAGPWMPVEAVDGVTDSPREQFHIAIDRLRTGEHLIVVRVYDTSNNAGLAKVVVK
jgi:sugar lactone lactonase YvrE